MNIVKTGAAAAALLALAGTAQALNFTGVDGGLGVLDSDTRLEWTADKNLNGVMNWAEANVWIATLNASHYAGHNDWRLPTLDPSDASCSDGHSCTGGEFGQLLEHLGGGSGWFGAPFWTGTAYALDPNYAWRLCPPYRDHQILNKQMLAKAYAVRPFDIAAAVPEPQTYAMLLLGLGAVVTVARRRRPD